MLNSYQDGCPINETHVFYTATNTFRNPIFEPQCGEPEPELEATCSAHPAVQQQQQHQFPVASPKEAPAGHLDTCLEVDNEAASKQLGALQKSCSNSSSFASSSQSELGQRWQDFCDSLSLSVRGRLFVMESNLKRRLRAMRKYLDKKVPWILPLVGKQQQHSHQQKQQQQRRQDKQRAGKRMSSTETNLGRFNFPEPSSARALVAQQECLLNRLERIKRQRLFRLPSHSLDMDDDHSPDLHDGASLDHIDQTVSSSTDPRWPDWRASGAAAGEQPAPVLLEDGAKPLSLFSSISHSGQLAKPKASGKPSRWISRSGRHIRDTALAFTSSKRSCIVCYERAPNIMTLPCEHSDICSDCFIEIIYMAVKQKQYPLRCVLCRQKVERIRCSRRLLLSVIAKNRTR